MVTHGWRTWCSDPGDLENKKENVREVLQENRDTESGELTIWWSWRSGRGWFDRWSSAGSDWGSTQRNTLKRKEEIQDVNQKHLGDQKYINSCQTWISEMMSTLLFHRQQLFKLLLWQEFSFYLDFPKNSDFFLYKEKFLKILRKSAQRQNTDFLKRFPFEIYYNFISVLQNWDLISFFITTSESDLRKMRRERNEEKSFLGWKCFFHVKIQVMFVRVEPLSVWSFGLV